MADTPKILLVDEDLNFLQETEELLNKNGYSSYRATNIDDVLHQVANDTFALAVTAVGFSGTSELEIPTQITEAAPRLPLLLVAAEPTLQSAMDALRLPVVAYLTKPIDSKTFLAEVQFASDRSKLYQVLDQCQDDTQRWLLELREVENFLRKMSRAESEHAVSYFLLLILKNAFLSLQHLQTLQRVKIASQNEQSAKLATFTIALLETVEALKASKPAFKSKELGMLRKRLQQLLNDFNVTHYRSEARTAQRHSDVRTGV